MHNRCDQYTKNLLREALSYVAKVQDTEVEVIAATQRIDVYAVPDPERAELRKKLGLLGELFVEPTMFEVFSVTPSLVRFRPCLKKQLSWHTELERRARVAMKDSASMPEHGTLEEQEIVPFPYLLIIGQGRPDTILQKFGGQKVCPGVYALVEGLSVSVVVLSELPRKRETLLFRLMGRERVLLDALEDLKNLPPDAQERCIAIPLLVHFRFEVEEAAEEDEQAMSAEIRAWYQAWSEEQARQQREAIQQAHDVGLSQGISQGISQGFSKGERAILLRQLRVRFGILPVGVTTRVASADAKTLEAWSERVLTARTLSDVFGEQNSTEPRRTRARMKRPSAVAPSETTTTKAKNSRRKSSK